MFRLTKKRLAGVVGVIAALAIGVSAYAYFTSNGTGSGGATVGSDSAVTIDPVTTVGTLYPGHDVTVNFTVNNLSSDTSVRVDKVIADDAAFTNGIEGLPTGCDPADFHIAGFEFNPSGTPAGVLIAEDGSEDGSTTLSMDNTDSNQDACKGAEPTLHLKVDNSGIGGS